MTVNNQESSSPASSEICETPENRERRETLEKLQRQVAEDNAFTGMFDLDTKINETDGIDALSAALIEHNTRKPDDGPTLG